MRRFDCDHTLLHDDERDDLRPVGVAMPGFQIGIVNHDPWRCDCRSACLLQPRRRIALRKLGVNARTLPIS
jgi:hypothetical protein